MCRARESPVGQTTPGSPEDSSVLEGLKDVAKQSRPLLWTGIHEFFSSTIEIKRMTVLFKTRPAAGQSSGPKPAVASCRLLPAHT